MNLELLIDFHDKCKNYHHVNMTKLIYGISNDYKERKELIMEQCVFNARYKKNYIKDKNNLEHNMKKDFVKYLIDKYGH
jgi:hypothetical protein